MFRYISEILSQFSTPQKIIALSLLLFSIVIISISPSLIGAINLDKDELKSTIDQKDAKILKLEQQVDDQELKIRNEQQSCTNEIVKREKDFISMLDLLKEKAREENNSPKIVKESLIRKNLNDTLVNSSTTNIVKNVAVKNNMENIIREIDIIKYKIKN
jgi:hypothetical protein